MRDVRDAKAMAHTLRAALTAIGLKITVGKSLELIAQTFGVADWNTLSAAIRRGPAAATEQSCSFCGKLKHEVRSLCEGGCPRPLRARGVVFLSVTNASLSVHRSMLTCCHPDRVPTRRREFPADPTKRLRRGPRHFVVWQSNCCPVTPRVAGPSNAIYGPVMDSGSGRVLISSAG